MAGFRNRRKKQAGKTRSAPAPSTVRPADGAPIADQMLLDLATGLRDLDERVAALEHKFDALGTDAAADDGDGVMELRLHTARLSAELTRVSVELQGQIAELAGGRTRDTADHPTEPPTLAGDETFEDLSADSPARAPGPTPGQHRLRGWQPTD